MMMMTLSDKLTLESGLVSACTTPNDVINNITMETIMIATWASDIMSRGILLAGGRTN